MSEQSVIVDRSGGCVTVTLNRPHRRNALDTNAFEVLLDALRETAARPEDRALVLTGVGDAFCSGSDLSPEDLEAAEKYTELRYVRRVGEVVTALHSLQIPTVAKVNGMAFGLGMNLALACDLVVASREAKFCVVFARRGLGLDSGGSWLLPRLVGLQKAKELAFFAPTLTAHDAAEIGLVTQVVDPDDLDKVVDDWAAQLAAGPTVALSLSKALLNRSFATSFEQAIEDEARSQHVTLSTRDAQEAIEAFRAKRPPEFTGR